MRRSPRTHTHTHTPVTNKIVKNLGINLEMTAHRQTIELHAAYFNSQLNCENLKFKISK